MDDFKKYEQLRDSNQSPRTAYLAAKDDGVDEIAAIRMLRRVFGLSIVDAKKATGANEDFEKPQEVFIGGTVYWEGADTVEGSYLMQAKVKEIKDGFAYLADHTKYLIKAGNLEETPAYGALLRIPLSYFEKSLAQRLRESADFWSELASVNANH